MQTTDWHNLSKKERRELKKEQEKLERRQMVKKSRLIKWGSIFGTLIILAVVIFLYQNFQSRRYLNAPKIQVTPLTYSFGRISPANGVVEAHFEVKNVGVLSLVISGAETSCGCTTAILKNNQQESPIFGMHNNPANWSTAIEPGMTGDLVVIFDPNYHKDTFGPITRTVSIFSNDPGEKETKVDIYANVQI